MKIALLEAPHRFRIKDQPIPEIESEEVLVRVAACGVCTSDFHPWEEGGSNLPLALGHEVSGVIEQVGSDANTFKPGVRVAVWATGKGYAEYVAVKAEYCFPAGNVPLDLALAEPLACAVNAVEMVDVSLGDDVVIIGAGFMGNLVQKLVALRGPRQVIVADTRVDALERASRLGANRIVNPKNESLETVVKEMTAGRGADVTFEITGTQAALVEAGKVTRMSGTIAIVGYHQGENREIPLGYWNWMAFRIANAHFREVATIMRGMEIGMRLLTSGRLSLDDLVTHRFPLAEIDDAFATAVAKPPGFAKATVVVDQNEL
jgi:2-desacetyl-2-hydroxyethyl bacteriochlorophyllide A dehydrogenase